MQHQFMSSLEDNTFQELYKNFHVWVWNIRSKEYSAYLETKPSRDILVKDSECNHWK